MGKKVPFWQFFRIFKNSFYLGTVQFPSIPGMHQKLRLVKVHSDPDLSSVKVSSKVRLEKQAKILEIPKFVINRAERLNNQCASFLIMYKFGVRIDLFCFLEQNFQPFNSLVIGISTYKHLHR